MRLVCVCGVLVIACAADGSARAGPVVFVSAGLSTGANDGTSWSNAFRGRLGLKAAIDSVPAGSGTEVWVAQGVYAPADVAGDPQASFEMKSGVALFGGFVGGETDLLQRDPVVHVTVLTGDLNSNDGVDFAFRGDNVRHVVRATSADTTAILDGFIVRSGGNWNSFPAINGTGAGILIEGGAPQVRGCTFIDCIAGADGAGAALLGGTSARLEACRFELNRGQARGAGVFIDAGSSAIIRTCEFRANRGSRGVGIYNRAGTPIIESCLFIENRSDISSVAGAGLFDEQGQPVVRDCDFIRNGTVGGGGGVYLADSQARISQCRFFANVGSFDVGDAAFIQGGSPTFVSCLMRGVGVDTPTLLPNASGCIVHVNGFGAPTLATFINCTLAGNARGIFNNPAIAAVLVQPGGDAEFVNCVLWENSSSSGTDEAAQVRVNSDGSASFDYCAVQGWTGMLPGAATAAFDPLFIDSNGVDGILGTIDDDLRPGAGSLCIDSGSNLALPFGEMLDALQQPRFRNDHATPDTGLGVAPIIDRGALEFQPPPCAGDPNDDGVVNFADITFVLGQWGSPFGFGSITEVLAQWGSTCGE